MLIYYTIHTIYIGIFILTWCIKQSKTPIKTEKIVIRPYGYKIRSNNIFTKISDLLNWFKKLASSSNTANISTTNSIVSSNISNSNATAGSAASMSIASKLTANTTYSVAQQIHKSLSSAVSSAATAIVQPLPPGAPGTAGVQAPRHRSQLFNRNVTTTTATAATPMLSQLSQPSPYPQAAPYAMQPSTPYQPAPTTPYNAYAVPLIPGPYGNIPTTPGQAYHTGQPGMGAYGVPPPPNATPGRPIYPPQPTQQRR